MELKDAKSPFFRVNCGNVNSILNEYLDEKCRAKKNHLRPCKGTENPDCGCGGCGDATGAGPCKEVKYPEVGPCVSISWGDSNCDCIESDDVEVLCITLCNCYSNITLENVVVGTILVTDAAGNSVATLPDGTPSVQAIPIGPICFGNIGPCKDGKATCVSREFVLRMRGAKGGGYQVHVRPICYDVTFHYQKDECFTLPICQD
ncbi:MAG TPA: hypothetical protein VGS07_13830 [Thermoanaerobaculia bacterium]|nr:hypothetical protein [Thermoanaerobaculia bacterium]